MKPSLCKSHIISDALTEGIFADVLRESSMLYHPRHFMTNISTCRLQMTLSHPKSFTTPNATHFSRTLSVQLMARKSMLLRLMAATAALFVIAKAT
jgi:hypothetical protein